MLVRPITGVLALAVLFSGPAQAEGLRAELHGGYDRLANKQYFSPSDNTFRSIEGAVYGFDIGYDLAVSETVFAGIEGNADFSSGSRCQANPLVVSVLPGIYESCVEPARDLGVNVRFGFKPGNGKTSLYALAGYSNLGLKTSSRINGGPLTGVNTDTIDGFRVGAGIEQGLGDRFYGKFEYRYTNYSEGFTRNQALLGLGVRF